MKKLIQILMEFIELTVIGAVIFVIVYLFVGQLLEVSGDSMEPNFHDSEQLIAEKLTITLKPIERGDVVIFNDPTDGEKLVIKRIVGLPNETFKISEGKVFIDGMLLEENYLADNAYTKLRYKHELKENEEYKLGDNSYIVLGDNRDNSRDSRDWGALHKDSIIGKALLIYYPIQNLRLIR